MRCGERFSAGLRAACLLLLCLSLLVSLAGCGKKESGNALSQSPEERAAISDALIYDRTLPLKYAEDVSVDYYKDGSALISVSDGRQYLAVAPGKTAPTDLPKGISVLKTPVSGVYLAGTASMDFFDSCGAIDRVRFSSQKADAWTIESAADAMKAGDMLYAGKYSAPDYELLTKENCGLAVENTMIYHSPTVIEKLEELGIPVFVDGASKESTPQARMEWVKVYGVLTGCEEAAEQAFTEQEKEFLKLEKIANGEDGKAPTVAFFSVRSNETVTVRRATDYIPYMIELAGGRYAFPDLGKDDTDSNRSTETISMEEFYTTARDADYFIFNSIIEGERSSIAQLLKDAPVLADCKAVKEGHVYCTTADLYQHSMKQGVFVRDLYDMLQGNEQDMTYLFPLN